MPKELERKLKAQAKKKFPKDKKRQDAYRYGVMRSTGWKPSREERRSRKGSPAYNRDEMERGFRRIPL